MGIKNIEIIQTLNALHEVSNVELPVRLAYAIKKNHKKLVAEYLDYEEQLNDLGKKYNGDKKSKEYGEELRELLDIEVDVDFYKISEDVFESGDFTITTQQLSSLDFMIE